MKTSELQGAALDWAVATCEGRGYVRHDTEYAIDGRVYARGTGQSGGPHYSTDWSQGGPIIEREGIELLCESLGFRWVAMPQKGPEWKGPTPLIAAMRCFVASRLGDEVGIPEELQ